LPDERLDDLEVYTMSGIAPSVVFHVNQIEVSFKDDIGNDKQIQGTGFWIDKNGRHYFVTNAHNIEPRMKLGPDTKFRLAKLKIRLRVQMCGQWLQQTTLCEVDIGHSHVCGHPTADVAVLENITFIEREPSVTYSCFKFEDLATQAFLENSLNPMDIASFIGFPGKTGIVWYDELWNLPIARTVNVASYPKIGFTNSSIPTQMLCWFLGCHFPAPAEAP